MPTEEKQLLLKDLCGRLPYKTIVHIEVLDENHAMTTDGSGDDELDMVWITTVQYENPYHIIKPYLRSMSSMTEEEKELMKGSVICFNELEGNSTLFDVIGLDWLNAHHFDYRGLIEKGLALEAPEDMYKTE